MNNMDKIITTFTNHTNISNLSDPDTLIANNYSPSQISETCQYLKALSEELSHYNPSIKFDITINITAHN